MKTQATPATSAPAGGSAPVTVEHAEAALVEHYPRLVRLAYVTLPAGLGKHHRTLAAHRLVQRALPTSASPSRQDGAYGLLRHEVLRAALEFGNRGRLRSFLAEVRPPQVLGLRVHPRTGADEEVALYRAVASLPAEARAAYALLGAEGLAEPAARAVLDAVGASDPRGAVRAAAGVRIPAQGGPARSNGPAGHGGYPGPGGASGYLRPPGPTGPIGPYGSAPGHHPLRGAEFDACTLQLRPTDLLRRRRRRRIGAVAAVLVAASALLVAVTTSGGSAPRPYAASGPPSADSRLLDPGSLLTVPASLWTSTARMDFSAWPARGGRIHDKALLGRALAVWGGPGASVDVSSTPGTARSAPAQPPQLLFAGDEDDATVVIFYDGLRVVRYAQPRSGSGRAALDFAQAADADLTTSAAVLVDRVDGNARFLTAPWVAQAQTRDLLHPDRPATALHRSPDGVTDPVPLPGGTGAAGSCGTTWPVMQLRSSARIAENHSFLLTDLGELAPAHLGYSPPSAVGDGGPPMEATGRAALASWAHSACRLGELRGQGVKSVNDWEYATTPLPEGAGRASWTCERADTWRGPGMATVQFVPPGATADTTGTLAGRQTGGSACSRFDQHVMAGVMWESPGSHWYLLAAASGGTASITATDGVHATAAGAFLAAPAPRGTRPTLSGRLTDGDELSPLSGD